MITRLLTAWIVLNVYAVTAVMIWGKDWKTRLPENDAAVRERMTLLRQRLAHPEESEDEGWVRRTNATARGDGAVTSDVDAVGQRHTSKLSPNGAPRK